MTISSTWRGLFFVLLLTPAQPLSGQAASSIESPQAEEIRGVIRAFYFHLAHQDWDAVGRQILPAKVVARWAPPDALLPPHTSHIGDARGSPFEAAVARQMAKAEPRCTADHARAVAHASVAIEGRWAAVSLAPCSEGSMAGDEFRLFFMQGSWRIVHIALAGH